MAFGRSRHIRVERRRMREEMAIVDASAVVSAATPVATGLSSNTPNLLARRSGAEIIFSFVKNFVEAPNVQVTAIGSQAAAPYVKVAPTASTFTVVTSAAGDDFIVRLVGSDEPSV